MSAARSLLIPAIVLLAACSTGLLKRDSQPLHYEDYAGEPVQSFRIVAMDSWEPVSRNQLLLWNAPSEAYLLTVWSTCNNLMFANAVRVSSTAREVSRVEQVTVDGMRCPIESIRPVDVKAMRADRRAREEKPPDAAK